MIEKQSHHHNKRNNNNNDDRNNNCNNRDDDNVIIKIYKSFCFHPAYFLFYPSLPHLTPPPNRLQNSLLVGLRLSDECHGKQNCSCGQQHLE